MSDDVRDTTPAGPPASGADGDGPLILLAEDNEDNRVIAATMLRHMGYRVSEATNGREAVEMVRTLRPALVLMDIGMPELDGWEATRVLKADPETRDTLVVALTAHAMAEDRLMAQEIGFDGYLSKPIELRRLIDEVRDILAGTSRPFTRMDGAE